MRSSVVGGAFVIAVAAGCGPAPGPAPVGAVAAEASAPPAGPGAAPSPPPAARRAPGNAAPTPGTSALAPTSDALAKPDPYADPAAPARARVAPASTGWITPHALVPPFDPARVHADAYLDWALALARREVADARLTGFVITGVTRDGHADLRLARGSEGSAGLASVAFVSAARAGQGQPPGAGAAQACGFSIRMWKDKFHLNEDIGTTQRCQAGVSGRPRCTVVEIWGKALRAHPRIGAYVALLLYADIAGPGRTPGWVFKIEDRGATVVSANFADDC